MEQPDRCRFRLPILNVSTIDSIECLVGTMSHFRQLKVEQQLMAQFNIQVTHLSRYIPHEV